MSFKKIIVTCLIVFIGLTLNGCGGGYLRQPRLSDLDSQDAALKIRAIKWVAEKGQTQAARRLVSMLMEEDRSIRFYAIEALQRLYGTDYGYDYKGDDKSRLAAVGRWRQALNMNEKTPGESQPTPANSVPAGGK